VNLPVKFPDNAEVIAEEAARFRALSPEERVRTIGEMFHLYHFLIAASARPEAASRLAEEDEERGRSLVQDFVARHG
jgi:hypothetical protein